MLTINLFDPIKMMKIISVNIVAKNMEDEI
jgi:hypothetical protein